MQPTKNDLVTFPDEDGVTLVLVAIYLVMLLSVCALAIDLASLYVTRNEAQRAADSAALAGAKVFVETGCVTSQNCSSYQSRASQRAIDVGAQNTVANQTASIQSADVTFASLNSNNPRITVVVQRSAARSNPVPTFFARIFGPRSADVSAAATAETYVPNGSGPSVCLGCVKPLVFPNCDPVHTSPANPDCGSPAGYFVDLSGQVANPGLYPTGVIGMPWSVHSQLVPSQYGIVDVGGGQSQLRQNFLGCSSSAAACGVCLSSLQGNQVGTVTQSVNTLINSGCPPNGCLTGGQDTITVNMTGPPFTINAGSNNPLVLAGIITTGAVVDDSPSVVTLALVRENQITPGVMQCTSPQGSGGYTVQGYMTVFFQDAVHRGTSDAVDVTIMAVSGCGAGGGTNCGSGGGVSGGGALPIPVRLVRNPGS